jgi:ferritin-like metal-binding protein YciE
MGGKGSSAGTFDVSIGRDTTHVTELDGTWDVSRTRGLLPPLIGVRKEIHGTEGSTILLHRAAGAPFDVVGLELHYRRPFTGFVDVLSPVADGYEGRSTFRGRTFAHFRMTAATTEGGTVSTVLEQLVKHIDEAHAMEQGVLRMLDGTISSTEDPELLRELEHHREETVGHVERMRARLAAHGSSPSTVRQMGGILGALAKLPLDMIRGEKAGRNARDGYATEHMEIASYELLARIADRAGDAETATAAREIIEDEREMAHTIEQNWDRFVQLSLSEAGAAK